MEQINISYTANFINYLDDLVLVVYKDDYFSFIENAFNYTSKIYEFIDNNIENFPHKNTPKALSKFGDFYIFYNFNSRTTWYIFFSKKQNNYLIKHITNNHNFDSNILNTN